MAKETSAPAPTITGNMLFYKQPELLNVDTHSKLGITQPKEQPFAFLRETQIIPITVAEFTHVALNYPIVFAGEDKTPAAVMGMKKGRNAFVDEHGKLLDGAYVPAFVRRYPFASAKNDADASNLMICIDRASSLISENPDKPFFEGTELTDMTNQAIEFVKSYETETMGTANFIRFMSELDMFETEDIIITLLGADGKNSNQKMGDYLGVSDAKLNKLSAEQMVEFRDNGALAAVYAHRLSQLNWQRLVNMEMIYEAKQQQTAGQA